MNRENHDDYDRAGHDDVLPAVLQARLAALRQDVAPQRDLWPAISAQLAQAPARDPTAAPRAAGVGATTAASRISAHPGASRGRRGTARLAPYAIAASVLVAVAVGWQLAPRLSTGAAAPTIAADAAQDAPLLRVADAMTREYLGALRELDAARAVDMAPDASGGVLAELDRSAVEVRAALRHDPDAVFLVQRLQRIYAQRLSLARRLA